MTNRSTHRRRWLPAKPTRAFSRLRPNPVAWLLAAALVFAGASQAASLPDQFSARYEVSHLGLTLGEATITYQELDGGRYRYSSHTRPLGVARWFFDATIEESSEGTITQEGFRPDRYSYTRSGKKARQARLLFDWQASRVTNDVAGHAWRMRIPDDAMDRMVTQLQLMHDLAAEEEAPAERLTYQVADGGKLKTFELAVTGKEQITTPYGRFETLKITEVRDDQKRATSFWVAPALDYLAVRIEHREHDDNFRMALKELHGFDLEQPDPLEPILEEMGVDLGGLEMVEGRG